MYTIEKTMEISASHCLDLTYESPCTNMHGHNWKIKVVCQSETLDKNGMVIDFTEIKKVVNSLDHVCINDVILVNPTAENMARILCEKIPFCVRVEVTETEGNKAIYEKV